MDEIQKTQEAFRLKEKNEQLSTLLKKAFTDLKLTTKALNLSREKSNILAEENKKFFEINKELNEKYTDLTQKNAQLKERNDYLEKYTQAVEGVASQFCDKTVKAEKKVKEIKRQSSMILSRMGAAMDISEIEDIEFEEIEEPQKDVKHLDNLKEQNYKDTIAKETQRAELFRSESNHLQGNMMSLTKEIEQNKEIIINKESEMEKLREDLKIVTEHCSKKEVEYEKLMDCFNPYLQMKKENDDLKRTSALLIGDLSSNDQIMDIIMIGEGLKEDIKKRDAKISELQTTISELEDVTATAEIASIKLELEEVSEKLKKKTDEWTKLEHENRILTEQRAGYGVPPPPAPPPPPPPPPTIKTIFWKKKKVGKEDTGPQANKPPANVRDIQVLDMMKELEKRLLRRTKEGGSSQSQLPHQNTVSGLEDAKKENKSDFPFIKLRSYSTGAIVLTKTTEGDELKAKLDKQTKKMKEASASIDEHAICHQLHSVPKFCPTVMPKKKPNSSMQSLQEPPHSCEPTTKNKFFKSLPLQKSKSTNKDTFDMPKLLSPSIETTSTEQDDLYDTAQLSTSTVNKDAKEEDLYDMTKPLSPSIETTSTEQDDLYDTAQLSTSTAQKTSTEGLNKTVAPNSNMSTKKIGNSNHQNDEDDLYDTADQKSSF